MTEVAFGMDINDYKGFRNVQLILKDIRMAQNQEQCFMYEEELSKLLEKLKLNNPNANTDLVTKAFWFCVEKHKGQKRVSGEDYATHPIAVANILTIK